MRYQEAACGMEIEAGKLADVIDLLPFDHLTRYPSEFFRDTDNP